MGRRRSLAFGTLGSLALVVTVVVSGACSSVPDITFGDPDGGGTVTESGVDGRMIDPNCKPTGAEICDDGLDNDCDGLKDCQDPKCTSGGFSCQDAPPDWKAVAFAAAARPTCAAGEASTDLMVAGGDSAAMCSTTCVSMGGSCSSGTYTLTVTGDPACTVTPSMTFLPATSGCKALPAPISVPQNTGHAKLTLPLPPTSCMPTGTLANPLTSGRECIPARYGAGCAANQVCAPRPAKELLSCVTKDGKSDCPPGFAKRSTAGTSAVEGRTCTGATCDAPSSCNGGSVAIYEQASCKVLGAAKKGAENIDTTCAPTQPNDGFTASFFTSSPPSGGCGVPTKQATANGVVAFMNERTVCCK